MVNPVLLLTHNNLRLTQRCYESILAQDIPIALFVLDSDSTDGTQDWGRRIEGRFTSIPGLGISQAINIGLGTLFEEGNDHVLFVSNDMVAPPWYYRDLLSYEVPFVTGCSVDTMEEIAKPRFRAPLSLFPDFASFLIRRECWEKVGGYDERMKMYYSDNDYCVRGHRAGVGMWLANVPIYHERSSTLRNGSPEEQERIRRLSCEDDLVFQSKYGCTTHCAEYEALFK